MLRSLSDLIAEAVDKPSKQLVAVAAVFLVFGTIDFIAEWVISAAHLSQITHGVIDGTILGGVTALMIWILLQSARDRRRRIQAEIEQSARLNHEIRNALEVISHAGYLLNDVVYGRAVAESIDRIDKTLRERDPSDGEEIGKP